MNCHTFHNHILKNTKIPFLLYLSINGVEQVINIVFFQINLHTINAYANAYAFARCVLICPFASKCDNTGSLAKIFACVKYNYSYHKKNYSSGESNLNYYQFT